MCLPLYLLPLSQSLCLLQPALEQLAFQNVGCSINACTSLAELVQDAQELRSLRLYNNMSDDAGAAAIAQVMVIGCFSETCSSDAFEYLAPCTSGFSTAKEISKCCCICAALQHASAHVQHVLADVHCLQILKRSPKLEAFRMASSRVGLDGGRALANSMTAGAFQKRFLLYYCLAA